MTKRKNNGSFSTHPEVSFTDTSKTRYKESFGYSDRGLGISQTAISSNPNLVISAVSEGLGWNGILAVLSEETPYRARYAAMPYLWLSMTLTPTQIRRTINGSEESTVQPPYLISIAGPYEPMEVHLESTGKALHVFIGQDVLREVIRESGHDDLADVKIKPGFGIEDPALCMLLRVLKLFLIDGAKNTRARAEHMARTIASHVLEKYSAKKNAATTKPSAVPLSAAQLKRTIDYIDDYIEREILIDDLAAIAGVSRTSFIRRFTAAMNMSPGRFVLQKRIWRAQDLIVGTSLPLAEVAEICGFASAPHLSVAFKRMVGITPSVFRSERS